MTAIPYRGGAGGYRSMIAIKPDHRTGTDGYCFLCSPSVASAHGWQSGAAMRDSPLPAAPVYAGRSR